MSLVVKHGQGLRRAIYALAILFCLSGMVLVADRFQRQVEVLRNNQGALLRQHSVAAFEKLRWQLEAHRLQAPVLSGLEVTHDSGCLEPAARRFLEDWAAQRSHAVRGASQRVMTWPEAGIASVEAPRLDVVEGALQLVSHLPLGIACAGGERLVLETRTESHAQPLSRSMPMPMAELVLHVALQAGDQPARFFDIVFRDGQAEYRPSASIGAWTQNLLPGLATVSDGRFQMALADTPTGLQAFYRSEPLGGDVLWQNFLRINATELALMLSIGLVLFGVLGFALHMLGLSERLHYLSTRDFLTGLHNRRAALERVSAERARALRSGRGFCIAQIDIDHFKRVNDTFGHDAGDAVLQAFAARLREVTREQDLTARMGGEEFLVLLPETDLAGAQQMAERLCQALRAEPVVYGQQRIAVTCSLGLTAWRGADDGVQAMLIRADQLLYQAKQQGRDRWVDDLSVSAAQPQCAATAPLQSDGVAS